MGRTHIDRTGPWIARRPDVTLLKDDRYAV